MVSLTLISVGFVVVTALVIVLARTSTARWERTGRAARAPRREIIAPGAALTGDAARQPGTVLRRVVAAAGRPGSLRAALRLLGGILVTAPKQVAERARPSLLRADRSSAVPVDADATQPPVPFVPNPTRRPRAARKRRGPGAAGRGLLHRFPSRSRRRRRWFLHRPDRTAESSALQSDGDETLTGG